MEKKVWIQQKKLPYSSDVKGKIEDCKDRRIKTKDLYIRIFLNERAYCEQNNVEPTVQSNE